MVSLWVKPSWAELQSPTILKTLLRPYERHGAFPSSEKPRALFLSQWLNQLEEDQKKTYFIKLMELFKKEEIPKRFIKEWMSHLDEDQALSWFESHLKKQTVLSKTELMQFEHYIELGDQWAEVFLKEAALHKERPLPIGQDGWVWALPDLAPASAISLTKKAAETGWDLSALITRIEPHHSVNVSVFAWLILRGSERLATELLSMAPYLDVFKETLDVENALKHGASSSQKKSAALLHGTLLKQQLQTWANGLSKREMSFQECKSLLDKSPGQYLEAFKHYCESLPHITELEALRWKPFLELDPAWGRALLKRAYQTKKEPLPFDEDPWHWMLLDLTPERVDELLKTWKDVGGNALQLVTQVQAEHAQKVGVFAAAVCDKNEAIAKVMLMHAPNLDMDVEYAKIQEEWIFFEGRDGESSQSIKHAIKAQLEQWSLELSTPENVRNGVAVKKGPKRI